jgi:hypothetical protein
MPPLPANLRTPPAPVASPRDDDPWEQFVAAFERNGRGNLVLRDAGGCVTVFGRTAGDSTTFHFVITRPGEPPVWSRREGYEDEADAVGAAWCEITGHVY